MNNVNRIKPEYYFCVALLCMWSANRAYSKVAGRLPQGDEVYHYADILTILSDSKAALTATMLPGYHYTMAAIGWLFDLNTMQDFRVVSVAIVLLTALMVVVCSRILHSPSYPTRALHFQFLPMTVVYTSVIYTDIFSAAVLLLATVLALRKRTFLSGVVIALSLWVRQSNIFWLVFVWALAFVDENTISVGRRKVSQVAKLSLPFFIGIVGFCFFVYMNDGIAVGAAKKFHQEYGIFTTNVFLLVLLLFLYALPVHLFNIYKYRDILRENKLIVGILFVVLSFVYLNYSLPEHIFNTGEIGVDRTPLSLLYGDDLDSPSFLILPIILITVMSMYIEARNNFSVALLCVFTVVGLLPISLAIHRYYIPFFLLWFVLRKSTNWHIDNVLAAWLFLWPTVLRAAL